MDQQRLARFPSQSDHLNERLFLLLPGSVNLAIKADFAEGNTLRVLQKQTQRLQM